MKRCLLAFFGLVAMTGCGASGDEPGAAPTLIGAAPTTTTATPTATPPATATATRSASAVDTWTVRPGRVGPIRLGMAGAELADLGYAVKQSDHTCGAYWQGTPELSERGIYLDFTLGGRNDLDQIIIVGSDEDAAELRTDAGVRLGDPVTALEAAYPTPLLRSTELTEGGSLTVRTAFGEAGALSYATDSGEVGAMYVTRGTDPASFAFPALGC